jgi:hypothetical protein
MGEQPGTDPVRTGQAWSEFCRALEQAGQVVLADSAPDTPLDRAEGFRYLTRLTREMLYSCIENADPDFPRFHQLDLVKIGADNPDNVYLSANIRGDRSYRITGRRGTIAYFSIGSKANRYAKDGTMASTGELSDADLIAEPDGSHEIIASAERRGRNWLPLAPDSTGLVVRQTYLDRATEVPGSWHIERIDGPTGPEIFYLHGYWQLEPDQVWLIQTEVPDCPYWNFQLNNWWMESLDHRGRVTVNKRTARLDPDGRLTLVVADRDPGTGNWIDTCGHRCGTALLRWLGADTHPIPTCRVVSLTELEAV